MDIRQCRRCRKLFDYRGNPNCPACVQQMDQMFVMVRNFLYDNPHADMEAICEASGAEENDVLAWLREGRLIVDSDMTPLLTCVNCRKPIQSGQYCDACAHQMRAQLEQGARQISAPKPESGEKSAKSAPSSGMHVDIRNR